jgi:phosphomannomutase
MSQKPMSLKFGTSGLRGLAEDLLTGAAADYAAAFAAHLIAIGHAERGDNVLVGRDLRASSPAIAVDVWRGLAAAGLIPVDCDAIPTPALALEAMSQGSACVMVTGSHIPADRNGLKFYRPDGEIDKPDELAISSIIASGANVAGAPVPEGMEDGQEAALDGYVERFSGFMADDGLAGMRIGIYEHSSVAREVVAAIVGGFGADVVALGRSEDFVPVDTEAVDERTIERLATWARDHRLDAILSTDGDGDRPLVADEAGRPLRGDALGLLSALELGAQIVVTPVTSNSGIDGKRGFEVVRTRVGSPYVIDGMAEAAMRHPGAAVIGFEANGGLLTATPLRRGGLVLSPLPTRDAVLPMLCALSRARATGQSLSTLVARLAMPFAVAGRIENYSPERSAGLIETLSQGEAQAADFVSGLGTVERVDGTDGIQLFLGDGAMIHFRPSGNAPEMRCYAEAPEAARAEALLSGGLARLRAFRSSEHRDI